LDVNVVHESENALQFASLLSAVAEPPAGSVKSQPSELVFTAQVAPALTWSASGFATHLHV
jgi:hypothetical protein